MGYKSVLFVIFACFAFAACNGKSNVELSDAHVAETETVVDTIQSVVIDSVAIRLEQQRADSVRIDNLSTADEAIEYMRNSPDSAKYEEGILISLASQNLDYTKRLLQNKYDYFIVADKPSMYVVLFDKFGREKQSYKMACGRNYGTKHKRSDCRTPEGFFTAEGIYDSTDWLYTDDNGYTSPTRGVYGPNYIRVTRVVGIHGTNSPWSLGRRVSHGCMRLHNNSILDLVKYAQKGMPVIVNPSDRDQKVNREEGYEVVQINIGKPKVIDPIPDPKDKTLENTSDSIPMATDSVKPENPSAIANESPVEPIVDPVNATPDEVETED